MKGLKKTMIILLLIVALIFVFLLGVYLNHIIQLDKEKELFTPLGQIVEVDGHNMSVYIEGSGDKTIVFMAGGGTCCPILDFKSLYSLLSDQYKIVVVEKFGYGFSDIVDKERNIESILADTRAALNAANIAPPYILCPHSISGIEALYWSQQYPEEVSAIIGLDMAVPNAYENYKINMSIIKLGQFATNSGLSRLIKTFEISDAMKYGTLTEKEKEIYKAVFYRRSSTVTMINEVESSKENARKVSLNGKVQVPVLLFVSNGKGLAWDKEEWRNYQKDFITEVENGNIVELDCPHYVHDYEYQKISEDIKTFLSNK